MFRVNCIMNKVWDRVQATGRDWKIPGADHRWQG